MNPIPVYINEQGEHLLTIRSIRDYLADHEDTARVRRLLLELEQEIQCEGNRQQAAAIPPDMSIDSPEYLESIGDYAGAAAAYRARLKHPGSASGDEQIDLDREGRSLLGEMASAVRCERLAASTAETD